MNIQQNFNALLGTTAVGIRFAKGQIAEDIQKSQIKTQQQRDAAALENYAGEISQNKPALEKGLAAYNKELELRPEGTAPDDIKLSNDYKDYINAYNKTYKALKERNEYFPDVKHKKELEDFMNTYAGNYSQLQGEIGIGKQLRTEKEKELELENIGQKMGKAAYDAYVERADTVTEQGEKLEQRLNKLYGFKIYGGMN